MDDIFDWTKKLQMATKIRELDEDEIFKIAKFKAWD
jgi:hypothetical protein